MAQLRIESFAGIAPKVSPKKLGDAMALEAHNVRLDRGRLDPLKSPSPTSDTVPATTVSLVPYQGNWLSFDSHTDVVTQLLPNDQFDRLYLTDGDYPKVRSGVETFRLGLPRPEAPTIVVDEEGNKDNPTDIRQQTYRVSFVTPWGEEGPLSNPCINEEVGKAAQVTLTLPDVPTGEYNLGTGALKRIYRSNTGSENSIWQYVDEVPVSQGTYVDTKEPGELQEQAITENWIGPPDDDGDLYPDGPLQGLCALPGIVLAGFTGNTVRLSEPRVPYAWPLDYAYPVPQGNIVAVSPVSGGLFVATDDKPYLLQGSTPAAMVMVPIESNQACVSRDSMVDMGDYCIYASPDGLVVGQANTATLTTESFVTKHEWSDFQPETIRAWQYEGKYIARTDSGKGFIYDLRGETATLTTLDFDPIAAYFDSSSDSLYFADAAGDVYSFDAGVNSNCRWVSKEYLLPYPVGMSCMRVEAAAYPVTIEVIADGKSRLTKDVKNEKPFRIPGGFKAKVYQVSVEGTNAFEMLVLIRRPGNGWNLFPRRWRFVLGSGVIRWIVR